MNNNIVDRIKAFMQYKSLNSLSLSKELGYNSSKKISRLFRDKKAKPSYDIIYDISNKFEINVDWLITGRGSMLKDEQKHENTVTPNTTDATYVYNMYEDYKKLQEKILVEKEKRIKELETKLAQLEKTAGIPNNKLQLPCRNCPKKAELIAYIRFFCATRCPDHKIKIIID